MGNRAVVQFTDGEEYSPVTYLHWDGDSVPERIKELIELMADRTDDVPYSAARFIGICHKHIPGNLSLGTWNNIGKLTTDDSHGDAGCFVVNVKDWAIENFG